MKRPLIYYTVSFFLGCFIIIVYEYNIFLGAAVAASFFSIILFSLDKKQFTILLIFFILGSLSFYNYYNVKIPNEVTIRITQKQQRYCIANCKGRKLYILGNIGSTSNGKRITIQGIFKKELDYKRGTIGNYKVKKYRCEKDDLISKLYNLKQGLFNKYVKKLGKDKASLVMGVCYGETKHLSIDEKKDFQKLGISHIISVSGFHMALVYSLLEKILGAKLSLFISFVYLLFTGSKAATVRAYIMIVILKLSKKVYRNYDSLSALAFSALILMIIRPYYISDIGFTLSFLATLGIILYNKKIQRKLYKLPKKINESLSITLSAQIFSMPYIMFSINSISLFFIPANLILIPMYSMLIFVGNIGIVFMNIPILKRLVLSALYSIITAIQGANSVLLKICPPVCEYNYFYGISLLLIIILFTFHSNKSDFYNC